jgi:hypothetical protein
MMYSRAERVVIFEQYFASKSFATAPETFWNEYPDKEIPNQTIIYMTWQNFWT